MDKLNLTNPLTICRQGSDTHSTALIAEDLLDKNVLRWRFHTDTLVTVLVISQ
jgi:hypothetical protein